MNCTVQRFAQHIHPLVKLDQVNGKHLKNPLTLGPNVYLFEITDKGVRAFICVTEAEFA